MYGANTGGNQTLNQRAISANLRRAETETRRGKMAQALLLAWTAALARPTTSLLSLSLVLPAEPACVGDAALHVHSALTDEEQHEIYTELCATSQGSTAWNLLADGTANSAPDTPWPLCVWQHPYTGESNAARPSGALAFGHSLARRSAAQLRSSGGALAEDARRLCEQLEAARFTSLVSLLYVESGSLRRHTDDGLPGIGLSLSFGAPSTFEYGGTEVVLASGDALFGAYGRVPHSLLATQSAEAAPAWWHALPELPRASSAGAASESEDGPSWGPSSFRRVRCNVQLRTGRDAAARRRRRERAAAGLPP